MAQSEEARVAELSVSRPLGETDLSDDVGLRPVGARLPGDVVREGRASALASLETRAERLERGDVEPRADLTRVDQLAVVVG